MSQRVTDEMVRSWLTWARNAGEVAGFRIGKGKARRFKVRVPAGVTCNGQPFRPKDGILDILGHTAEDVVPGELMFTAREAIAFAMGCATARAAALACEKPEWLTEDWTAEQRAAFAERREAAMAEHAEELEREHAEHEAERQRRIAEYKRRREGTRQIDEGKS